MLRVPCGVVFAFIIFFRLDRGTSHDICRSKSILGQIRKQMLCGYDRTIRPVSSPSQTINISTRVELISLDFNEEKRVLKINSYVYNKWKDSFIKWPSQYVGEGITISSEEIWSPYSILFPSSLERELRDKWKRGRPPFQYWLQPGTVMGFFPTMLEAHCTSDLTRWPMDEHTCSYEIGSQSTRGIEFTIWGDGVTRSYLQSNNKWELLIATLLQRTMASAQNESYDVITYFFTIRRHSGVHLATVVMPALVLSVVTLLTFFLETGPERITLSCTSALAYCLYLQYLGMKLPPNGNSVPAIVAFFRDSVFLVGVSLLLAVIVRGLEGARAQPPAWLSSLISALLSTPPGRLFMFSYLSATNATPAVKPIEKSGSMTAGESRGRESASSISAGDRTWQHTALLFDRIALVSFIITIFVLLSNYIPS